MPKIIKDEKIIKYYETMIAYDPINKKECGHEHTETKQVIKCLCSFGRLEKGWKLIYKVQPYYQYNTSKQVRAENPLPETKLLEFQDLPAGVQRGIMVSFNYYRARYNGLLPISDLIKF